MSILPKQLRFIESDAREVGYAGAWRAGKSRALGYKLARKAQIKGNFCVLCRATLTSLRETTLRVLLEPEGDLPPVLPKGTYIHDKSKHLIHLHDGGTIFYFGFDRFKGVKGLTAGSIAIDEVIEIDKDKYEWLLSRLTHKADPNHQLFWATNPGSPSHFLHKRFYKETDLTRELIHTTAFENTFLPADYIKYLRTLTGLYRDRYVLGKWVAFEGMVFDNWRREMHLRHRDEFWKWLLITVDEGYENPCSAGLHAIDTDNRMHRLRTFYKRHVLQEDFVKQMVEFGAELRSNQGEQLDRIFVVDPSAAGLIAALEDAGLQVEKADNSIVDGIQEMRNRLAPNGDNMPRYTIEPEGEGNDKFVEEIESYHYDKDEKPAKSFDHAMDEARYGCMYMRELSPPTLTNLASVSREPEAHEFRKREVDSLTGEERDILREQAIKQGYVPEWCSAPGALVMALVISDRKPCIDCANEEKCRRVIERNKVRRDELLSREAAWR